MVLQRLRRHTTGLHERAELALDLNRRCRDKTSYRALLGLLYGVYEPLEAHLSHAAWADTRLDFSERRKAPLLKEDLRLLGLQPEAIKRLPRCNQIPRTESVAAVLGMAYVLEGATLGGQIVARHLHEKLNIDADTGARFYTCYGPKSGLMWRNFCSAIEAWCAGNEQREGEAVEAAAKTFQTFIDWLERS